MNGQTKLNAKTAIDNSQNDEKRCQEIESLITVSTKLLAEKKQNEFYNKIKEMFNLIQQSSLKASLGSFCFEEDLIKALNTDQCNCLLNDITKTLQKEKEKKDLSNTINDLICATNDTTKDLEKLLLTKRLPGANPNGDKSVIEALDSVKNLRDIFIESRQDYAKNHDNNNAIKKIRDSIKVVKPQNAVSIYQIFLASITRKLYESETFNPIITRLSKSALLTKMGFFTAWNKHIASEIKNDFCDYVERIAPCIKVK